MEVKKVTVTVTAKNGLRVRSKPTTNSSIVDVKPFGMRLEIKNFTSRHWSDGYEWNQLNSGGWIAIFFTEPYLETTFELSKKEITPPVLSGYAENIYDREIFFKAVKPTCFNEKEINMVLKHFDTLNLLDVENPANKMKPTSTSTFCNIYAFQHYEAMTSHLRKEEKPYYPRLWWYNNVLSLFYDKGFQPVVSLKNLWEVSANDSHNWFLEYGKRYGWSVSSYTNNTSIDYMKKLQAFVNDGGIAYIVALRKKYFKIDENGNKKYFRRSGHVTVVIPEIGDLKYSDKLGVVQSQAGATNKKMFIASSESDIWYDSTDFESVLVVKFKP